LYKTFKNVVSFLHPTTFTEVQRIKKETVIKLHANLVRLQIRQLFLSFHLKLIKQ